MRFLIQLVVTVCLAILSSTPVQGQALTSSHSDLLKQLQAYEKAYTFFMQNRFDDAISSLKEELPQHENDSQYFYLLGVLQLKAQQQGNAADSFERVVLIDPNNAGAWLDLAIANLESGHLSLANDFLIYVKENFNPPAAVLKIIDQYQQRIITAQLPLQKWQSSLEFMAGRDTNANSGLQSSSIPVTFLGERYDLPLDLSLQAKADNFAQLSASTRYRKTWDTDGFDFSLAMRNRSYRVEHPFSSLGVSSAVAWQHASKYGLGGVAGSFDYDTIGGKGLLQNFRLSSSMERAWRSCRYGLGVEQEWRRYITLNWLDANMAWGQFAAACEMRPASYAWQFAIVSRIGMDKPVNTRAGGKTRRKETVLQVGGKLSSRLQLDFVWNFSSALDQFGYSPLQENNAVKEIFRRTYRTQFLTPMLPDLDLFLRIDENIIRSNLVIFRQKGRAYSLGLQKRF